MAHQPIRMCVGCRARGPRAEMLKIAVIATPGATGLQVDPSRRLGGRGANVHPSLECLDKALDRGTLKRALRYAGPVDRVALRAQLEAAVSGHHMTRRSNEEAG